MLKGELISFRPIEKDDLEQLLLWRNNSNFRKYFREYRELNMEQQLNWFNEKVNKDDTTLMFAIINNENEQLIGCCGLVYINWVHRHADLSLYIGWDNSYIDSKGFAKESCRILLNYAFDELCLNKVWTEIYEFDNQKWDLYNKIGFTQDGMLRENYWYNGKWWGSRMISILSSDYRPK